MISVERRYRGPLSRVSPGMSLEMMLTVSRPPMAWSSVASCRASCGTTISQQRIAISLRIVVSGATAAAKTVLSMPSL